MTRRRPAPGRSRARTGGRGSVGSGGLWPVPLGLDLVAGAVVRPGAGVGGAVGGGAMFAGGRGPQGLCEASGGGLLRWLRWPRADNWRAGAAALVVLAWGVGAPGGGEGLPGGIRRLPRLRGLGRFGLCA